MRNNQAFAVKFDNFTFLLQNVIWQKAKYREVSSAFNVKDLIIAADYTIIIKEWYRLAVYIIYVTQILRVQN